MSTDGVVVSTDGGLLRIVLDRATARNALRAVDMRRITAAVTDAVDGGATRAILIRSVGPHFSLSATKGLLRRGLSTDLAAALESELVAVELTVRSSDFKEGIAAFGQRRRPEFTGR